MSRLFKRRPERYPLVLDASLRDIVERLKQNDPTLLTLCMPAQNIGAAGAQVIADALRENSTLLKLDVRSNGIGVEGARLRFF